MDILKSIDSFPKALDDFRIRTTSGAVVSIVTVIIMIILLSSEFFYHYKTEVVDHLYVNTTRHSKLQVDFDFSFPEISCDILSINAVDETGKTMEDVVHQVYKYEIDKKGNKIGMPEFIKTLGETISTEKEMEALSTAHQQTLKDGGIAPKKDGKPCGNCYGAGSSTECCNSCDQVKEAYEKRGWVFVPEGIEQCNGNAFNENLKNQFGKEGGCQIYGRLDFKQLSGNFHIAPHKKLHTAGHDTSAKNMGLFNLLDLISFTFDQFNITHRVNYLRIGDTFPGVKSPLDGVYREVIDTHGMYQYYLKIVPTRYKSLSSKIGEVISNQYSVTEHLSHLAPGSSRGLPGLYFHYEVSPIQAHFEEKRSGGLAFLVSACAIAGGFFTVMGLVDKFIGWIINSLSSNPLA